MRILSALMRKRTPGKHLSVQTNSLFMKTVPYVPLYSFLYRICQVRRAATGAFQLYLRVFNPSVFLHLNKPSFENFFDEELGVVGIIGPQESSQPQVTSSRVLIEDLILNKLKYKLTNLTRV